MLHFCIEVCQRRQRTLGAARRQGTVLWQVRGPDGPLQALRTVPGDAGKRLCNVPRGCFHWGQGG